MFAFGSGLCSTYYSLKIVGDVGSIRKEVDLEDRLARRVKITPQLFVKVKRGNIASNIYAYFF